MFTGNLFVTDIMELKSIAALKSLLPSNDPGFWDLLKALSALLGQPEVLGFSLRLKDRFGDHGLISIIIDQFSVRFHVGEVEATRNIGEFADLILKRMQEP